MRFRRKVTFVEAIQWPGFTVPLVDNTFFTKEDLVTNIGDGRIMIHQNYSDNDFVNKGDWIVREPNGELTVYSPAKFEEVFEHDT